MKTLLTGARRAALACAALLAGTAAAQEKRPPATDADVEAARTKAIELCGKLEFTTASDVLKEALKRTGRTPR